MPTPRPLSAFLVLLALPLAAGCSSSGHSGPTPTGDGGVVGDGGLGDGAAMPPAGPIAFGRLRTEYRVDPIGIDVAAPRLEWQLTSTIRGEKQTAYRVLVASSAAKLAAGEGDLWDSGQVASAQSTQIAYQGAPLASRQTAFWKVKAWDKDSVASDWSAPATWEMGLVAASDWQAKWITTMPAPAPFQTSGLGWIWYPEGQPATTAPAGTRLFRRTFTLPAGSIKRATLSVTCDDDCQLYVNGQQLGATDDWHTVVSFDLGNLLAAGSNTIAIAAINEAASPAGLLAQLQVDLGTGTPFVLSSDTSWKSSNVSPAPSGWTTAGFDDSAWPATMNGAAYGQGPWGSPATGSGGGGPARYLRRAFNVAQPVKRARLYATALGLYEATINGQRVGNQHFSPGWTDYAQRLQYQTYDVTSAVASGDNVLGLVLGDGWYQGKIAMFGRNTYGPGQLQAFAQLELQLADGTTQVIASDGSWTGSSGPIVVDDLLDGEGYDARRELAGWDGPGTAAASWPAATVLATKTPRLVAQPDDGIVVETERPPVGVKELAPGLFIYDFGQNMVGWTRLSVSGKAGAMVQLRFAEVLNPDGSIYTTNLRSARATDVYTLRGAGTIESHEPRFTTHGFRYVELSGDIAQLGAAPDLTTLTGIVAHAATPVTGTFRASEDYVNQLQSNIEWSQKDNFTAVPTDCPQRDERLGWMGDAQIFARTATYNMDVAAFYTKWTRDVDDAQFSNGGFSDVSPHPPGQGGTSTPAWGDAGVIVPWTVYLAYGDKRILGEHYGAMVKWLNYIASNNPNYLWQNERGSDFGDWLSINADTDKEVLATAFYAHSVDIVSQAAHIIGNEDDSVRYRALFASIKSAFDSAYLTSDGHIRSDTQTAYALALRFNLVPDALRASVGALLAGKVQSNGGYLNTGFLGVGHLLPALSSVGHDDVAYQLLGNRDFPSWRYEIDRGATTVWERWDGIMTDGTFETPTMNSFNHYSFGSVDEWMYGTIAGLQLDEAHPGWTQFLVRPRPGGGLTSARATFNSPQGGIVSDWKIVGTTFTLAVTVPVNASATVYLPYSQGVQLDGAAPPAAGSDGGYGLGSGSYVFTAATQ